MPKNEIAEALDRAAARAREFRIDEGPVTRDTTLQAAVLALIDAVTEIAAVLPEPNTVPKE